MEIQIKFKEEGVYVLSLIIQVEGETASSFTRSRDFVDIVEASKAARMIADIFPLECTISIDEESLESICDFMDLWTSEDNG